MIKITERTIYKPLISFLEEKLKAKSIQEVRVGHGFIDIYFQLDSVPFIVEVKFGGEKEFARAIAQVYEYAMNYGTKNVIAIVYPERWKDHTILDISKLSNIVLSEKVIGRVYTDYWTEWIDRKEVSSIFEELERRFRERDRKIDFNSIVNAIRENVLDLHSVIRQAKTEEIFEEVATKLELFAGLGEIKDKQRAKEEVSMLASYLLFNQLLFYHVYKTKSGDETLEELKPIKSIKELKSYFSKILAIDYQPVYNIRLTDMIPERPEVIELINNVIKNLVLLRVEHITQDLAGRFFHALLPKEVAKVWAAFYTNLIAAKILANLAIDRWDETVLDPACGSGTLLAACYRRKLDLYKEQTEEEIDDETINKLHKRFIEEDITGIDIMPFAAHLTTINLTTQKLEQPANVVRIACMDSLELSPKTQSKEFKEKGILLKTLVEEVQLTLTGERVTLRRARTVSPNGIGKEFYLKPVDVVIMNPPFSDRRRLPKDFLQRLGKLQLENICGSQINLWGYFLVLSDAVLKPNGKMAAVLPIAIARGESTQKIRDYILSNYHIKYLIKSTKNLAFSESAAFRDILFLAEKTKANNKLTTIVFIKKDFKLLSEEELNEFLKNVKNKNITTYRDQLIEFYKIPQNLLLRNRHNFMKYLWATSVKNIDLLDEFITILERKEKIATLKKLNIRLLRGFETTPKGLVDVTFITNPFTERRKRRALIVLIKRDGDNFYIRIKDQPNLHLIKAENLLPALRTALDVATLSIKNHDYLIVEKVSAIDEIKYLTRWKGKIDWNYIKRSAKERLTYFSVLYKFNLYSPNTHILSFFSDEKLVPANIFMTLDVDMTTGKIFSLFFNSIIYLTQLLVNKTETTGQYVAITKHDLENFNVLDISKLGKIELNLLLSLFEKIKEVDFPSILEQLEKKFWARVELDKTILKILGFSDKEIEEWLPKIYDIVAEELKAMKEVR